MTKQDWLKVLRCVAVTPLIIVGVFLYTLGVLFKAGGQLCLLDWFGARHEIKTAFH